MKKITLVFIFLFTLLLCSAQQTISFEASEGYSLGDINTQNGWVTTGTGPGTFITNQVVSDELATDGSFALKIVQETAFPGQANAIVGAFYDYSVPVAQDGSTFSADINITQQDANSSNFLFGLVNSTAGSFIAWFEFDFQGNIFVLVDDGLGTVVRNDTGVSWAIDTWYNVRMEINGSTINFFLDDTQISTGTVILADDVEQVRFSHDNFGGSAYIDNFRTNDENLSVDAFEQNSFSFYYEKSTKSLNLESSIAPMKNIEIYSIIGNRVMNMSLSTRFESIDLTSLSDGIYLARISTNDYSKTIKFLKN
ncbi:T9SS type A sorting domain-containing protein [Winogradskyella aurantia]|uniref:Secretion system C-terminal sorting domain-containing protein n=1 Tax=Winogradskyella aurantia TaxID=1915063 RepID=A0A265UP96_9FLAO|nr:T9SS type A sorting domain-containing protein [Winogradskyella aurantia]OZV67164.1 hypothetical protein CA834_12655 [Winogradskyella aurantia]